MKTRLDLSGCTRIEVLELAKSEGYSKSTAYASIKRGWIIVTKTK